MKILLIAPQVLNIWDKRIFLYEPLGLEYIANAARDDEVRLLDMRLESEAVLDRTLNLWKPDVVGLTAYFNDMGWIRSWTKRIKSARPATLTVLGGSQPALSPESFECPELDIIVRGEGVETFGEILQAAREGRAWGGIPGTYINRGNRWRDYGYRDFADFDAVPEPRRELVAKYSARYHCSYIDDMASLRASQGCHFRCNFCTVWAHSGTVLRRSVENIVREIDRLPFSNINFTDDEAFLDRDLMAALAQALIKNKINKRYIMNVRIETVAKDPGLFRLWKEAGLRMLFLGLEAATDDKLKSLNKGNKIRQQHEGFDHIKRLGLETWVNFIVFPSFDQKDFRHLRRHAIELNPDILSFTVLTPIPGSPFYQSSKKDILSHDYRFYDLMHAVLPTKLPVDVFYRQLTWLCFRTHVAFKRLAKLFTQYPLRRIPSIVLLFSWGLWQIYRKRLDHRTSDAPIGRTNTSILAATPDAAVPNHEEQSI